MQRNRTFSVSDLRYLSLKHELTEIKNELKDTRQQVTNVELESKDILQASQVTVRKPSQKLFNKNFFLFRRRPTYARVRTRS